MNKNTLIIAEGTTTLEDVRQYITDVVIPDSVTEIRPSAFCNCSNIKSITIPDSVTSIEWSAFEYCESLKEITIPNSVTEIGDYAFWGCSSLTEITIPYSVIGCSSLKSIFIDKEKGSLDISKTRIPETCKVYWKGEFKETKE